jgi:hypothetical protein
MSGQQIPGTWETELFRLRQKKTADASRPNNNVSKKKCIPTRPKHLNKESSKWRLQKIVFPQNCKPVISSRHQLVWLQTL